MTPSTAISDLPSQVAAHGARLDAHDKEFDQQGKSIDKVDAKLDKLLWWIIGSLGAGILSFAAQILKR